MDEHKKDMSELAKHQDEITSKIVSNSILVSSLSSCRLIHHPGLTDKQRLSSCNSTNISAVGKQKTTTNVKDIFFPCYLFL